jgi:hypothetical protein
MKQFLGIVLFVGVAASVGIAASVPQSRQVPGVAVAPREGYVTVSWQPVAGAAEYHIERTPVGADDTPIGEGVLVGVWRPNRQVRQGRPTFADAGFIPGL